MLAEPKSKKQWTLCPRVTAWSQDDTKFGQRMLTQMGWQKGKGLGKNMTGRSEHIRVRSQSCSRGLGYEGAADEWVAHQDGMNAILADLHAHYSTDPAPTTSAPVASSGSVSSLELSSKNSRSRLHYHKFTRGKDLSRYSERDVAAILGRSGSAAPTTSSDTVAVAASAHADVTGGTCQHTTAQHQSPDTMTTFNSGVSVKDYFASKMKKLAAVRQCGVADPAGGAAQPADGADGSETAELGQQQCDSATAGREQQSGGRADGRCDGSRGTASQCSAVTEHRAAQSDAAAGLSADSGRERRKKCKRKHADAVQQRSCPLGTAAGEGQPRQQLSAEAGCDSGASRKRRKTKKQHD